MHRYILGKYKNIKRFLINYRVLRFDCQIYTEMHHVLGHQLTLQDRERFGILQLKIEAKESVFLEIEK